jgi:hypothetical protein
VRSLLLRYVRQRSRRNRAAGTERRVFILLWTAYGLGGTIRAALNLGEFLVANGYEVEVISAVRDRDAPFFGGFPSGVRVTVLDDRSDGDRPRGVAGLLRRALRSRASVLMPTADRPWRAFSLWTESCVTCGGNRALFLARGRGSTSCSRAWPYQL